MIINVVEDFTDTPGARYKTQGSFSGEEFRDNEAKIPEEELHQKDTSKPETSINDKYQIHSNNEEKRRENNSNIVNYETSMFSSEIFAITKYFNSLPR